MALLVVAEDDDDIRNIMVRVLRRGGHEVVEAVDGVAGLEAVRRRRPDAVITDIDMPAMNGSELCLAIRADDTLRDLPVIFVSGSLMPGDTRPADAGATAALAKPFKPGDLTACLDRTLAAGHRQGQAPATFP